MASVDDKTRAARVLHWTQDVKPGDVLKYWFDEGATGAKLCFVRVEKVCPVKLKVRTERGEIMYRRPTWFHGRVTPEFAAELRADGINI